MQDKSAKVLAKLATHEVDILEATSTETGWKIIFRYLDKNKGRWRSAVAVCHQDTLQDNYERICEVVERARAIIL